MSEASLSAEKVWKAFNTVDCEPYLVDPRRAGLAAALEALADEVAKFEPEYMRDAIPDAFDRQEQIRESILAIAAALRAG